MKKYLLFALMSLVFGFAGSWIHNSLLPATTGSSLFPSIPTFQASNRSLDALANADFIEASKKSTPTVVFIKTISPVVMSGYWSDWFNPFGQRGETSSSGSGVIVSHDGYIVTNNHVVERARSIEVILDNNRYAYKATVVGTDPSTDLALLKIEAKDLPAIAFGNSEQVQIGEWVLA